MNQKEKLNEKELEELRKFFENDRFAMTAGCRIDEVGNGWSICSMNITDAHRNAFGMIMGGAMMTLADFAAAVIGNRPGKYTTANSVTTTFVGNSKSDKIIAHAKLRRDGRSTNYIEVEITDKEGKQLAFVTVLGFHLN
ncbi:MAG: PaaI family thioesterase [Paludibacteraceae bacterium]|nr:PaaI family thioesterase [Paludibacteraceae bacterium]MBP5137293.1 PaaI family thioesterase [Paludibacteraceae bacterium]